MQLSYVSRNNIGRIQLTYVKMIEGYPILMTEILTIRKVFERIIHEKLCNVIIESGSLILLQVINEDFKSLSQICSSIMDSIVLLKRLVILSFYTVVLPPMC